VGGLHGDIGRSAALARSGLTRREYEVLRLAAQGRTNPEIAETTGLARNTVKTYLQSALHKLGARNRVEAIGRRRGRTPVTDSHLLRPPSPLGGVCPL
jgi:Response regulator containing a CheY-like receiver domain and an HTH DNA-binding domain